MALYGCPAGGIYGRLCFYKKCAHKYQRSLSNTLNEINLSADQVFSGSAQVSDSAQTFSEGAADQPVLLRNLRLP